MIKRERQNLPADLDITFALRQQRQVRENQNIVAGREINPFDDGQRMIKGVDKIENLSRRRIMNAWPDVQQVEIRRVRLLQVIGL